MDRHFIPILAILFVCLSPTYGQESQSIDSAGNMTISGPILVTDVGQGNTAKLINMLLKRSKVKDYQVEEMAKEENLDGKKSLIVGVGASTKGLGAAGLDLDQEMSRSKKLLDKAKESDISIVGVHIGGIPRRGELSDKLNELVFEYSDLFIVWKGGNEDGFFTKLSEQHKIPLNEVDTKPAVGSALTEIIESKSGQ